HGNSPRRRDRRPTTRRLPALVRRCQVHCQVIRDFSPRMRRLTDDPSAGRVDRSLNATVDGADSDCLQPRHGLRGRHPDHIGDHRTRLRGTASGRQSRRDEEAHPSGDPDRRRTNHQMSPPRYAALTAGSAESSLPVPDFTISPVSNTYGWWARLSAWAAFCSTISTVVPCWLISVTIEKICWINFGARPIDGSSSN